MARVKPTWQISTVLAAVLLMASTSCRRAMLHEEKIARSELRQALSTNSYDKATELARRVLVFAPHDDGAWARLAQAQLAMHDITGATQTFEEWSQAVPRRSAKFHESSGQAALLRGDRPAALQSFEASLQLEPHNVRVLRRTARLREAAREWEQAAAAWTAIIKVQDSAPARLSRANCRRRLREWDPAFEDIRRAGQIAPADPEVKRVAELFERISKFLPELRDLDRELITSPADPALLTDRALLLLRSSDPELAEEDASAAAKMTPWAVRPVLFRALALIALGKADEAEQMQVRTSLRIETLSAEFLETISRLDSEISVDRRNAELFTARAWQLNDIGQPLLALQDAQTALRLDAKSAGACAESGYALMKVGRAQEAFDVIKRATELDPNFSTAWQYRGELEMVRVDFLTAIDSLSRALAINETANALKRREECYRRVGLLVKAEQDKKALEELTARGSK